MKLRAFQGIRYRHAAEAGELAAPPYDQIDDALRDRLHQRPHHFAHLIRPIADRADPYRAAASQHRRWLASGILQRDAEPALWAYEIRLGGGGRRLGICGLVGLELPDSATIRPHEDTVERTVAERLSLLRAMSVDLEPILLLSEDRGELDRLLEADIAPQTAGVTHRDPQGHQHCLYRIGGAERIEAYRELLAPVPGLIADGHHRYRVAQRYAAEVRAAVPSAASHKLAVVTSLDSEGLRIDPIHRQLERPVQAEAAAGLCSHRRPLAARSGEELAAAVAASEQPAIAMASSVDRVELWRFAPQIAPPTLPEPWRHLAVGWLHGAVLPRLGLDPRAATDGTVRYRSAAEQVWADLRSGEISVGFWLPPMTPADLARATAGGGLLPPKSTRFLPKLASGLVWVAHDSALA